MLEAEVDKSLLGALLWAVLFLLHDGESDRVDVLALHK